MLADKIENDEELEVVMEEGETAVTIHDEEEQFWGLLRPAV